MRITKFVNATPAQCRAQRRTFLVTGWRRELVAGSRGTTKNGRGKVKRGETFVPRWVICRPNRRYAPPTQRHCLRSRLGSKHRTNKINHPQKWMVDFVELRGTVATLLPPNATAYVRGWGTNKINHPQKWVVDFVELRGAVATLLPPNATHYVRGWVQITAQTKSTTHKSGWLILWS